LLYLLLSGQSYPDPCIDQSEDALSMSDITDIDDVTDSAAALRNTFSGDVIDDADLSSARESLSCDLLRYLQRDPIYTFRERWKDGIS